MVIDVVVEVVSGFYVDPYMKINEMNGDDDDVVIMNVNDSLYLDPYLNHDDDDDDGVVNHIDDDDDVHLRFRVIPIDDDDDVSFSLKRISCAFWISFSSSPCCGCQCASHLHSRLLKNWLLRHCCNPKVLHPYS